jgi:glycosyltransferase involved in cell wall biosynthesis
MNRPDISLVIPVFNEAQNLRSLAARLASAVDACDVSYEAIFVDDGSSDESLEIIRDLCAEEPRFRALSLSRNFGKEVAIVAGLDDTLGRAVVIMDADLQHPPEVIPQFIEKWREGYKNVYGERIDRATDPKLRAALTHVFYRLLKFGDVRLPPSRRLRLLTGRQSTLLTCAGARASARASSLDRLQIDRRALRRGPRRRTSNSISFGLRILRSTGDVVLVDSAQGVDLCQFSDFRLRDRHGRYYGRTMVLAWIPGFPLWWCRSPSSPAFS